MSDEKKLTPLQIAARNYALAYSNDPRNIQTIAAAAFYSGANYKYSMDAGGTPAAGWREAGDPDPHPDLLRKERTELVMGNLTDDELANGAFLNYDQHPSVKDLLMGNGVTPIVWMTAVKDRIRWLSRKLVEAQVKKSVVPSEETFDAARPLFLALESGYTSIEDVRDAISHGGRTNIDHLPEWFRTGKGHLTKAGRAEIAWHMMHSAHAKAS